jgi:hypothetical protein
MQDAQSPLNPANEYSSGSEARFFDHKTVW